MPHFTLRIELLGNPSHDVYEDLHARMHRSGFRKTVTGKNPKGELATVSMPHATYYGFANTSTTVVLDWAQAHAREVWGKNVVFVAETSSWACKRKD